MTGSQINVARLARFGDLRTEAPDDYDGALRDAMLRPLAVATTTERFEADLRKLESDSDLSASGRAKRRAEITRTFRDDLRAIESRAAETRAALPQLVEQALRIARDATKRPDDVGDVIRTELRAREIRDGFRALDALGRELKIADLVEAGDVDTLLAIESDPLASILGPAVDPALLADAVRESSITEIRRGPRPADAEAVRAMADAIDATERALVVARGVYETTADVVADAAQGDDAPDADKPNTRDVIADIADGVIAGDEAAAIARGGAS